jgi:osmotically inducible protein OsmC
MPKRTAAARWEGGVPDGSGNVKLGSGAFDGPYSFQSRFEDGSGTNPEELVGAAHAGCFSMALSLILGEAGMTAEKIETHAAVTLEKVGDGFSITSSHLDVTAKIPGADPAKFQAAAEKAKAGCPLSKVLNAKITMNAKLES